MLIPAEGGGGPAVPRGGMAPGGRNPKAKPTKNSIIVIALGTMSYPINI